METMDNAEKPAILVLRPQPAFEIVGAELRRVPELGRYMTLLPRMRSELMADDEPLRPIVTLCEELLPGNLYVRYANKKVYKHESDFWATDDKTVSDYVKRQADHRLHKIVVMAAEAGLPVLFAPADGSPLHIENHLVVNKEKSVTPVMLFQRRDDGISYRLQLRIDGELMALARCELTVLSFDPGIFILNSCIYFLSPGFNAKLLLPFTKKEVVEIPKRMEHDYMHRFVIRYMAKAEIIAEGFDVEDAVLYPTPLLNTDNSLDGRKLLRLSFRYGDNEYTPDSRLRGRVILSEKSDGSFRFERQMRDSTMEAHYIDILCKTDDRLTTDGIIRFDTLRQLVEWLKNNGPQLRQQGFSVVQPSEEVYYIGPMSVEQSDEWQGDWLQTRVTVVLDGGRLRIPFSFLRNAILQGEQEYMLPTGERLLIPEEWMQRYGDLLLVGQSCSDHFKRHRSQVDGLNSLTTDPSGPTPGPSLVGRGADSSAGMAFGSFTLRPYQQAGFVWLWNNFINGTGCCLSDEMGLGKTIQTIALLLNYKKTAKQAQHKPQAGCLFSEEEMRGEGRIGSSQGTKDFLTSLVIAPASVVHNWMAELKRFAPSLTAMSYTGDPALRRKKRQAMMRWDVVVTTYGTLLSDITYLQQQFGVVVMDESQTFKNHHSQIFHAVSELKALWRLALSGTPVENHLMELWSLMSILCPHLLGDEKHFLNSFVQPIARHFEQQRAELLQRIIKPYFLKRTKEQVLSDLPPRQDEVIVCPMTEEQQSLYATELSKARNEWLDGNTPENHRRMSMFAALQRLRHIANGEGKMQEVFERLETLKETGHKVLIFSEYVTMLSSVGSEMKRRGWSYDLLTGQTTRREDVISHFQQTASCQFFLISLKAGGVGLNLTAADYVFVLDPWWNLAAEEQAIARAHRIGQHRPVFVYRFVSENTLEQQILTLQERKQDIIDGVMPFVIRQGQ